MDCEKVLKTVQEMKYGFVSEYFTSGLGFLRCVFWMLMVTPLFFLSFTHEKGSKKHRGKRVFDPNEFSALVMLGVLIYLCYTTIQVARDVVKQDYVCVNGTYSYFAGGRNHGCVDVVQIRILLMYIFHIVFQIGLRVAKVIQNLSFRSVNTMARTVIAYCSSRRLIMTVQSKNFRRVKACI